MPANNASIIATPIIESGIIRSLPEQADLGSERIHQHEMVVVHETVNHDSILC